MEEEAEEKRRNNVSESVSFGVDRWKVWIERKKEGAGKEKEKKRGERKNRDERKKRERRKKQERLNAPSDSAIFCCKSDMIAFTPLPLESDIVFVFMIFLTLD